MNEDGFVEAMKTLTNLEVHPGKCRSVLIPIHVGGNHWVLGMFDINRREVVIYDSMGCKEPSPEQIMLEDMFPTLVSQWDPLWIQDRVGPWVRVYSSVEQQPDKCSGGVYMLGCLDSILRGYSPSDICIASCVDLVRECIAEDLLVCGVNKKEFDEAFPKSLIPRNITKFV